MICSFITSRYYQKNPCAIQLACQLLHSPSSSTPLNGDGYLHSNKLSSYEDELLQAEGFPQQVQKDDYSSYLPLNGRNDDLEEANYMVNETVLFIDQLCNAADVHR